MECTYGAFPSVRMVGLCNGYVWNAAGTYCVRDPNRDAAIDEFLDAGLTILDELTGGGSGGFGGGGAVQPADAFGRVSEGWLPSLPFVDLSLGF